MNPAPRGTVTPGKVPGQTATAVAQDTSSRSRPAAFRIFIAICGCLLVFAFMALGTWQLKRLQWKLDLIERVDQRVHAPAVAAPAQDQWQRVNADADEYRHVRVTGTFLYPLTVRVQASTDLGGGFWLLTPLRGADGSIVLINRGFIPSNAQDPHERTAVSNAGISIVIGLLRMSEPGGGFLRHNDPSSNRWYSRDVKAIAAARGLTSIAPYFIDAEATKISTNEKVDGSASKRPVAGLTVIAFHNNHLVYALTWYALALMLAGAGLWVAREDLRLLRLGNSMDARRSDGVNRESEDGKK